MKKWVLTVFVILNISIAYGSNPTGVPNRILIDNQSGGLNTQTEPGLVPNNQCYSATNVEFDEGGLFKTRTGYALVSSTPSTTITEYSKTNGQTYLLNQYQNRLSYSLDNGVTWTVIRTDIRWEDNFFNIAVYDNKAWMVDGGHYLSYFDGDLHEGLYYVEIKLEWLKAKYLLADKNKLFAGNNTMSGTRIYYNDTSEKVTSDEAWPANYYIDLGGENGDSITSLFSWKYNLTMVSMNYSLWLINEYSNGSFVGERVDMNNGSIYNRSMATDKNIVKFLSHSGLKGYNGSAVQDIDDSVSNIFDDCNNIKGGYNFLTINNTDEFSVGTSTGIDYASNDLKLNKYTYIWDDSNWSGGTSSNTTITDSIIRLSTTTEITSTRYDTDGDIQTWNWIYLNNGAKTWENGEWLEDDTDTSGGSIPLGSDTLPVEYHNSYNMDDNGTFYLSTKASSNRGYNGGYERKSGDDKIYKSEPYYRFTVPLNNTIIDNVRLKATLDLGEFYLNTWGGEYCTSPYYPAVIMYMDTTLFYTNGGTRKITRPVMKRVVNDSYNTSDNGNYMFRGSDWMDSELEYSDSNDIIIVRCNESKAVDSIDIEFRYVGYYFDKMFGGMYKDGNRLHCDSFRIGFNADVPKIYDISIYEKVTNPIFKSAGYYIYKSTHIADTDFDVYFGTITISTNTPTGTVNTTKVRTSKNNSTWTAKKTVMDGYDMTAAGVTKGKYIEVTSSFTTTISSWTPNVNYISIEAIVEKGTWTSKAYHVDKVDGGWKQFIESSDLYTQTANFYYRYGTSESSCTSNSWHTIINGGLIGATTNQDWIQFQVRATTTDGTENPTVYSLMAIYVPDSIPIVTDSISYNSKLYVALSTTTGATSNEMVMVQDSNNAFTEFDINVVDFCKYGKDLYFTDGSAIYKFNSGTTDNGSIITSEWKKRLTFDDYSHDKWLTNIFVSGLKSGTGSLQTTYYVENSTIAYTDYFSMTGSGRFRHQIPVNKSAGQEFDIVIKSTSTPITIYPIEVYYETDPILQKE